MIEKGLTSQPPRDIPFGGSAQAPLTSEDGTSTPALTPEEQAQIASALTPQFDDNLAEFMDDDDLMAVANDIRESMDECETSRDDWKRAYKKGLDLLGYKVEERTIPWDGACGVVHPILSEALTRFVSQSIMELCPANGPVDTKIRGEVNDQKIATGQRVKKQMNSLLLDVMKEYRPEYERTLMNAGICGSGFRKWYFDPILRRPMAISIPPENILMPYEASDVQTAPIYNIIPMSENEIRKLQVAQFYRDIDFPAAGMLQPNEVREKKDRVIGITIPSRKGYRSLVEAHIDIDLPGFEDFGPDDEPTGVALPYVATLDVDSNQILSIRRNWKEGDPLKQRRRYYVQHPFQPGFGIYGFGLTHQLGGIARSATSITRMLVDAGTMATLPAGFKARGLRIKSEDKPLEPGEWRDVDVPGAKLSESLMPLPYKEPSQVLAALLGSLVEEGRRFASLNDVDMAQSQSETPVGTTLARLESAMKVMSAIHARLHAAQKEEFEILIGIIRDYMITDPELQAKYGFQPQDFQDLDIVPVSDPNATTFAQRVMQQQTAFMFSQAAPQVYNLQELHHSMLMTIGMDNADRVVPPPNQQQPQPMDPISENAGALTGAPLKAFAFQNHEAHLAAHQAFLQDPQVQQNPLAQKIIPGLLAHVNEHLAQKYMLQAQQMSGIPFSQGIPSQLENQIASAVVDTAKKITGQHVQEAQYQQAVQNQQDPVVQNQQKELALKAQQIYNDFVSDMQRFKTQLKQAEIKQETELTKAGFAQRQSDHKIAADLITSRKQADARNRGPNNVAGGKSQPRTPQ